MRLSYHSAAVSSSAVADTGVPPAAQVLSTRAQEIDLTRLLVVCLVVLGAVIRFWRIRHQSFWFDEGFTVAMVHRSFGGMLRALPSNEITPPLYFSIAWVWGRVFSFGEAGLRSLSAIAGVAIIPAAYAAAAKLVSRRAGLVTAALVASNPLLIWYSQEARSYELLVLTSTVSLLAFAYVLIPHPTARGLWAWALAASLTLTTHYYGAVAVVPQALWLLWVHRFDRRVWLAVAAAGAVGLALLPLALDQRQHANWIALWPLHARLGQIPVQFVVGTGAPARTWLKLAGALAIVIAAAMLVLRADAGERRGALTAGGLAIAGIALSLFLVLAGSDEIITRNLIPVLVPSIVLVAAGLGARRAGAVGLAGVAALCAVGLIAAIGVALTPDLQRPDWRDAARLIGQPSGGVGRAVVIQDFPPKGQLLPQRLYLPELRHMNAPESVNQIDIVAMRSRNTSAMCWWGAACNLLHSRIRTGIRVPGFRVAGPVLHAGKFSILRLQSAHPIVITPYEVSVAFAGSRLGSFAVLIERRLP